MVTEGVSARRAQQMEAVERFVHTTTRTDWDVMVGELFDQVIHGCPYGIATVTKRKVVRWHRLVIRINDLFEPIEAALFVRRELRVAHFDTIFKATDGMERHERYDLYKITDARLGLPLNSLVYGIQHAEKPELRCLLVFGGERLEGHMERSLELVQKILTATPTNKHHPPSSADQEELASYGELIAALRQVNVKELDQMDINDISDIVNGLDTVIKDSPAILRAKYRTLSDYLMNRRRTR